jgi:hypothetical protein
MLAADASRAKDFPSAVTAPRTGRLGRSLDRPSTVTRRWLVIPRVTALQHSEPHPPKSNSGAEITGWGPTPLYDALVLEYRMALRCVPGDRGIDPRAAIRGVPADAVRISATVGFPHDIDALSYSRSAGAVPRQLSRHRAAGRDDAVTNQTPH